MLEIREFSKKENRELGHFVAFSSVRDQQFNLTRNEILELDEESKTQAIHVCIWFEVQMRRDESLDMKG